MRLNLILARAANGVIGAQGTMPWHLPEDLAHLKRTTLGWPVIMGRKTWDSVPARFRPLPGRVNIVVTHQKNWNENGAKPFTDLHSALRFCEHYDEVWVIGGAQLYEQALPLAQRAVVTEIAQDFDGDTHAPQFGPEWREVAREPHVAASGLAYSFVTLERD